MTCSPGELEPAGDVVVIDEIGFHHATSVAELLADRGCAVEVVTPGMVVGQDLGITLDLEQLVDPGQRPRASCRSIELVAQGFEPAAHGAGGAGTLLLQHHPTGRSETRQPDWVVLAVPANPAERLYLDLRAAGVDASACGGLRGATASARRGHRGRAGGVVARRGTTAMTGQRAAAVIPVRAGELAIGGARDDLGGARAHRWSGRLSHPVDRRRDRHGDRRPAAMRGSVMLRRCAASRRPSPRADSPRRWPT